MRHLHNNLGFTLLEVLAALAVTAVLMSAITLNLGARDSLIKTSAGGPPKVALKTHLEQLLQSHTIATLQTFAGADPSTSDLSSFTSTVGQRLVSVSVQSVGTGSDSVNVLAISVSQGGDSLTRWLAPIN